MRVGEPWKDSMGGKGGFVLEPRGLGHGIMSSRTRGAGAHKKNVALEQQGHMIASELEEECYRVAVHVQFARWVFWNSDFSNARCSFTVAY